MSRLKCASCGYLFYDGAVPMEELFALTPDLIMEDLVTKLIQQLEQTEDPEQLRINIDYLVSNSGGKLFKCPDCSSLTVFWNGTEYPAELYAKATTASKE